MSRPLVYKAQTLTSGLTLAATGVDLGDGWREVYLQIPTLASGSTRVQCSFDGTNYYGTAVDPTTNTFTINSTITNCIVKVNMAGRHAKVESTSGCTDAVKTYNWICIY